VKLAIDLDAVLGDTHALWDAWLDDAARRFKSIAPLEPGALPLDRVAAADTLDRWAEAGIGDWRSSLERFAEDHAPLFVRPDASATAALRRLQAGGARLAVFTDAPESLALVAAAHLGLARRVETIESGAGAEERAVAALGEGTRVVGSRDELLALAP
jgi:phosphoglycolate phosphatase-like HAD superfamily hydrolase